MIVQNARPHIAFCTTWKCAYAHKRLGKKAGDYANIAKSTVVLERKSLTRISLPSHIEISLHCPMTHSTPVLPAA